MFGPLSADVKEYAFIERPTREFVSISGRRRRRRCCRRHSCRQSFANTTAAEPSRQERVSRGGHCGHAHHRMLMSQMVKLRRTQCEQMSSGLPLKDGVIGRPSLWIAEDFWVLRFRLMVKRGPWLRPQASEGEAQHGPFWRIGRIGQGDEHLHCG
jgi:hypothetical protein